MYQNNYNNIKNKKNNFLQKKDYTINSIKEIEFFLHNLTKALKSFKIIKFFK